MPIKIWKKTRTERGNETNRYLQLKKRAYVHLLVNAVEQTEEVASS
jgi:hypothetical protein